ncbi:MAG: ArsR/SmtB family transcription factor [Candidatus Hecatellaceae archaeon]
MSSEELLKRRAYLLRALADPVRLEIVEFLREGEKCVCEIIPRFGKAQSTISKHLDLLYRAGILDRRVDGRRTLYRVKNREIFRLLEVLDRILLSQLKPLVRVIEALRRGS